MLPTQRPSLPPGFAFQHNLPGGFYGPSILVFEEETKKQKLLKYVSKKSIHSAAALVSRVDQIRAIGSPIIVPYEKVIDFSSEYIVLVRPFIEGMSLWAYVVECQSTDNNILFALWKVVVRTIQHLHTYNICPNFIKPSNILVADRTHIFIVDILAPPDDFNPQLHLSGPFDIGFLSPEFFSRHRDALAPKRKKAQKVTAQLKSQLRPQLQPKSQPQSKPLSSMNAAPLLFDDPTAQFAWESVETDSSGDDSSDDDDGYKVSKVQGAASDVFALGVLLFFMMTKRLPWNQKHIVSMVQEIADATTINFDDVPEDVRATVAAMLVRDPDMRPTTASLLTSNPGTIGNMKMKRRSVPPSTFSRLKFTGETLAKPVAAMTSGIPSMISIAQQQQQQQQLQQHQQQQPLSSSLSSAQDSSLSLQGKMPLVARPRIPLSHATEGNGSEIIVRKRSIHSSKIDLMDLLQPRTKMPRV